MKKRIYIETTIPSFYHTRRQDVESRARMHWTRQWWDESSSEFSLISSAAVIAELSRGTSDKVEHRLDLLRGVPLVPINEEVETIARIYIDREVMPRDPQGDALHLAAAAFHKADFLLTWNCVHLANPNKLQQIRLLNFDLGLASPTLTTPLNFLSGGES